MTHCNVLYFLLSNSLILTYSSAVGLQNGVQINIDNERPPGNTTSDKKALRYGFQQTKECQKFDRAFVCIRKCLDLDYDVAYADKNCACTCYKKHDIAQYKPKYAQTRTKWKLGAPTTSLPAWVVAKLNLTKPGTEKTPDDDDDDNAVTNDDKEPTDDGDETGGTGGTGGTENPTNADDAASEAHDGSDASEAAPETTVAHAE